MSNEERINTLIQQLSELSSSDEDRISTNLRNWVNSSSNDEDIDSRIRCMEFLVELLRHRIQSDDARLSMTNQLLSSVRNFTFFTEMRDRVTSLTSAEGSPSAGDLPTADLTASFFFARLSELRRFQAEVEREIRSTQAQESAQEIAIEEEESREEISSSLPPSTPLTNEERKHRILAIQRNKSLSPADKAREMQALFSPVVSSTPESGRKSIRKQVSARATPTTSPVSGDEALEPVPETAPGVPSSSLAMQTAETEPMSFIDGVSVRELHDQLLNEGYVVNSSSDFLKKHGADIRSHFPPIAAVHAQVYDIIGVEVDGRDVNFEDPSLENTMSDWGQGEEVDELREFVLETLTPGKRLTYYKKLMPFEVPIDKQDTSPSATPIDTNGKKEIIPHPPAREMWHFHREEAERFRRVLKLKTDMTLRDPDGSPAATTIPVLTPDEINEMKEKRDYNAGNRKAYENLVDQIQGNTSAISSIPSGEEMRSMDPDGLSEHLQGVMSSVMSNFFQVYQEMEDNRPEPEETAETGHSRQESRTEEMLEALARGVSSASESVSTTPVIEQVLADVTPEEPTRHLGAEESIEENENAEGDATEPESSDLEEESEYESEDSGYISLESEAGAKEGEPIEESESEQETEAKKPSIVVVTRHRNVMVLRYGCQHYIRNCALVCPDCQEVYPCRLCHDDDVFEHKFDRYRATEVVCYACSAEGKTGELCSECGFQPSHYYCEVCHFYDDFPDKKIYHCDQCGICRVGDKDKYFHCSKCGGDWDKRVPHQCISNALKDGSCPICRESLFATRQRIVALPCKHPIHASCLVQMHQQNSKPTCPVCSKLAISGEQKKRWESWMHEQMVYYIRAQETQQDLPPEVTLPVGILCHECGTHFEAPGNICGIFQCPKCKSHNTSKA